MYKKNVLSYINLKDTDTTDELPVSKRIVAVLFNLNKNREAEAQARLEKKRAEDIAMKSSSLEEFLDKAIKELKDKPVYVAIDDRLIDIIPICLKIPKYRMYNIQCVSSKTIAGITTDVILKIEKKGVGNIEA